MCTSPKNRYTLAATDGLTCANAAHRESVRTPRVSASVRAIQGLIARGSHASPSSYGRLHTPSSKRAPLAKLGLTAERSRPQHGDSFEVAAGQDGPLRTDGLAASVAACRTS